MAYIGASVWLDGTATIFGAVNFLDKKVLDTVLVKQMAENNVLNGEYVFGIASYIIDLIQMFQPPFMDEETNKWKENVMNKFKQGFEYHEYLLIFFESKLDKILLIKDYITKIKKNNVYNDIKKKFESLKK